MIDRSLRDRYSRQTMFRSMGEEGQAKLLASTAVIVGCGALGTNIANFLVRAGTGNVRIVDRDFIEYHNLQRQVLFDEDDIKEGLPKAIAAERHLRKINSTVKVEGIVADANYTNIEGFCQGAHVILDGLDNLDTRFLINDVSLKHKIPWIYGGAIASTGMTMTIVPGKTPCYSCIHPALPKRTEMNRLTCETAGVIGTAPAVVGALQATEAIKVMIGAPELNEGIVLVDVWQVAFDHIGVRSRPGCPACGGRYQHLEERFVVKTSSFCGQSRAVQVVDTRVKGVVLSDLAARIKGATSISYNEYMLRLSVADHEIIVFPDGRAIIKDTIDESLAEALYAEYVSSMPK